MFENLPLLALGAGVVGIIATFLTFLGIKRQAAGTQAMQDLAHEIHVGAMAFLRAEYIVLIPFMLVVAVRVGHQVTSIRFRRNRAGSMIEIRNSPSAATTIDGPLGVS